MAKVIATIGGIALAPGVSANRRLYTREAIGKMVARAQKQIAGGGMPLTMLSHHAADDDSTRIVGRITSMHQDEDGAARFTAAIADTDAGRDIAALTDTSGGTPFLRNVSIRGHWVGTVRKTDADDGKAAETGDDMALQGVDFTKSPGVSKAAIDTFAWAESTGRNETDERVLLTESVQEAQVTFTDEMTEGQKSCADLGHQCCRDATDAGAESLNALRDAFGLLEHVLEDGLCVTCGPVAEGGDAPGDGSKPYGNVAYADPGYQGDKKKRYPLDSKAHAKSAWSYINQAGNAAKYTAAQLKRVKGRIMAALKKFGVSVSKSEAWAVRGGLAETVAEHFGDEAGSFSVSLNNGMVCVTVSSYCIDPCDLDVIASKAMDGACLALGAMDPDMDGDIDVPGADSADDDDDNDDGMTYTPPESAPADTGAAETTTDPAPEPAAEPQTESEVPAMTDTATAAVEASPAAATDTTPAPGLFTLEQVQALLSAGIRPVAEAAPAAAAPAAPAAEVTPASAGVVGETAEQRMARLEALADKAVGEAAKKAGLVVEETDEQIMNRLIEQRLTPLRQAAAERDGTGTARKGLLESIAEGAPGTAKTLQEASNDDLARLAAAAYPAPPSLRARQ